MKKITSDIIAEQILEIVSAWMRNHPYPPARIVIGYEDYYALRECSYDYWRRIFNLTERDPKTLYGISFVIAENEPHGLKCEETEK